LKVVLLEMRSHILWYLKGLPNSSEIKTKICAAKSIEEVFEVLDSYVNTCS